MTAGPLRINTTRLRRFYKCEYEWYAYVVLGIDALRPPPSPHRDRGKVFHYLLEYAFNLYATTGKVFTFAGDEGKGIAQAVLFQLHEKERVDLDEDVCLELLEAARYHLAVFDLPAWEVVTLPDGTPLVEADLKAPHPTIPDAEIQSKVDVVLRRRSSGKVWLVDFKTTSQQLSIVDVPPWIEHNDQLALGREVLKHHGITVDFSALLHLHSRAPTPPPLVNKGRKNERTTFSASNLSCDWETYRATLIERGEDPTSAAAAKVKEALSVITFTRWQHDITDEQGHAAVLANITRAALRMRDLLRSDAKPVRRLSTTHHRGSCHACDYAAWCTAAMRNGTDDLSLLGGLYSARDHSPYAGHPATNTNAALFNPATAYIYWAHEHGRKLSPTEEFKP